MNRFKVMDWIFRSMAIMVIILSFVLLATVAIDLVKFIYCSATGGAM